MILQPYITLYMLSSLDKETYNLDEISSLVDEHNDINSRIIYELWVNAIEFNSNPFEIDWDIIERFVTKEELLKLAKAIELIYDNIGNKYCEHANFIRGVVRDYTMGLSFQGVESDERQKVMRDDLREIVSSLRNLAERFPFECVSLRFVEDI